jgi:DNA-binding NtrC family response regulator
MGLPVILCVDDEAVILLSLRQELRRRFGDRYAIETAIGAQKASETIARLEAEGTTTALVVCDWFMPGISGDQFLAELHDRRPLIKAILMTGQAEEESIRKATERAGICASVTKPWRPEELARAIEACLGGTRPV